MYTYHKNKQTFFFMPRQPYWP